MLSSIFGVVQPSPQSNSRNVCHPKSNLYPLSVIHLPLLPQLWAATNVPSASRTCWRLDFGLIIRMDIEFTLILRSLVGIPMRSSCLLFPTLFPGNRKVPINGHLLNGDKNRTVTWAPSSQKMEGNVNEQWEDLDSAVCLQWFCALLSGTFILPSHSR